MSAATEISKTFLSHYTSPPSGNPLKRKQEINGHTYILAPKGRYTNSDMSACSDFWTEQHNYVLYRHQPEKCGSCGGSSSPESSPKTETKNLNFGLPSSDSEEVAPHKGAQDASKRPEDEGVKPDVHVKTFSLPLDQVNSVKNTSSYDWMAIAGVIVGLAALVLVATNLAGCMPLSANASNGLMIGMLFGSALLFTLSKYSSGILQTQQKI